jgi:toxin-antitoxin system PIN domain toxin
LKPKAGKGLFLLDVSTLIALAYEHHTAHEKVEAWFDEYAAGRWATCPMTECGFVRVISNPKFASSAPDLGEARQLLAGFTEMAGHHFWSDDMRLTDVFALLEGRLHGHQQITDAYLLALTISKKGQLVTLDRGIAALAGPEHAVHVLAL